MEETEKKNNINKKRVNKKNQIDKNYDMKRLEISNSSFISNKRFKNNNNEININEQEEQIKEEQLIEKINSVNDLNLNSNIQFLEKMSVYMDNLVLTTKYEKSYMHRGIITHLISLEKTNFIITISDDGIVKMWKKLYLGIEFQKQFKAHNGSISGVSTTNDGLFAVTCSDKDRLLKTFDVVNTDLINFIKLSFQPNVCSFISKPNDPELLVLINEKGTGNFHLINSCSTNNSNNKNEQVQILKTIKLHESNVIVTDIRFIQSLNTIISTDKSGNIEVWDCSLINNHQKIVKAEDKIEIIEELEYPKFVSYKIKSLTDYYSLNETNYAINISLSKTFKYFALFCADKNIRIFSLKTGLLKYQYDESLEFYLNEYNKIKEEKNRKKREDKKEDKNLQLREDEKGINNSNDDDKDKEKGPIQEKDDLIFGVREDVFLKKYSHEKEFDKNKHKVGITCSIEFDETDNFIYYTCILGVKLVHLKSNRLIKIIGSNENDKYINISLFQGKAQKNTSGMVGNGGETSQGEKYLDPTLIASTYNKTRFYLFTQREPDYENSGMNRDIFNEKPTKQEIQEINEEDKKDLPTQVIIDTSYGEIHIRLYPNECPKTVKNFISLANNGFYNNLIFHKVVKGFIIQTGCPYGNGKGGQSVWGGEFEDEFTPLLKHDRAYTVSMANRGPNTNGSQFYITTKPAPWLDNKHTIFGRVFKGMDTVQSIESVPVDKQEKPLTDVKVIGIRVIK